MREKIEIEKKKERDKRSKEKRSSGPVAEVPVRVTPMTAPVLAGTGCILEHPYDYLFFILSLPISIHIYICFFIYLLCNFCAVN